MSKVATVIEVENLNEITDVLPTSLTASGNFKISLEEGGAGDGAIQDGANSSIEASVLDYTNSNPLAVRLTNIDGDYVSAGAGTEYTEDAASPANPSGGAVLVTRDDQLSTVTEAAGDWSRLRGTAKGALWVALADASGDPITSFGGGTEYTEDVATANPQVGKAIMMERDDALTTVTPVEGDWIGCRGTAEGALWTQDFNSDAIKTAVETLDNAISGSEMQCDIVASLPAGTNNIGDIDVEKNVGTLSPNNSTTTPLGIDAVFTGTADDIKDYAAINIAIFADQASATDGLSIEWSQDGTNWDEKMTVSIAANKVESYEFGVRARYFRLVYTNGGTEQTAFRLQVMYHPVRTREGARCLCVDVDSREFARTMRAVLAGKKPNGDYTNIHSTANGNLKLSLEEIDATLIGGGTEASALRVTLANDSTGLVSIDDGGGSITVDGTFYQATQPVSGTFYQATQPVSGTLTVDLGANNDVIATGNVAHDGADSGNPIKTGGRAQEPTAAPDEVADNDRVDTLHDRVGRVATYQGYPRWYAAINTATSGNNTIKAAAGAGKKIVVTSVTIISDGTVDIRWESGAGGTALSGQMPLQEREGYSASDPNGLFETAANALLNLELSAAINVHGHIAGIIIDD